MSRLTHLFARHQATLRSAGTPEAVAERKVNALATQRAREDRRAKFPAITPDNFEAAAAYQEGRIAHHRAAIAKAEGR